MLSQVGFLQPVSEFGCHICNLANIYGIANKDLKTQAKALVYQDANGFISLFLPP